MFFEIGAMEGGRKRPATLATKCTEGEMRVEAPPSKRIKRTTKAINEKVNRLVKKFSDRS